MWCRFVGLIDELEECFLCVTAAFPRPGNRMDSILGMKPKGWCNGGCAHGDGTVQTVKGLSVNCPTGYGAARLWTDTKIMAGISFSAKNRRNHHPVDGYGIAASSRFLLQHIAI